MHTLILKDGTRIEGLDFQRNIFWSDTELKPEMFRGKMNPITITSSEPNDEDEILGVHAHMEVCYIKEIDGKYALALGDIPDETWDNARRDANIAYIAMMTNIEL